MIIDTISILIGLVLGMSIFDKVMQAKLQKALNMGKKNIGLFDLKLNGKTIGTYITDFGKLDITIGNNKFVKNADRIYTKGGLSYGSGNEGSTEMLDWDAQARNEVYVSKCPDCGKEYETSLETIRPIPDPKVYNDIIVRSISWGMTVLQDKRTQQILIVVGVAIVIGLINALLSWNTGNTVGGVGNQCASMQGVCMNLLNATGRNMT